MKGQLMFDAMVMGAILLITIIILSTAFGKGVIANAMTVFGGSNSQYLGEEFSLLSTVVQYAPGNMEAGIVLNSARNIKLNYNADYDDYELNINSKIKPLLVNDDPSKPMSIIPIDDDLKGKILFKKIIAGGWQTLTIEVE